MFDENRDHAPLKGELKIYQYGEAHALEECCLALCTPTFIFNDFF